MSTTIDEKVVEMRFDNKQFEEGVQTSLSTLGKLKQSLNLDGAAKGFEDLGSAAKKCDMSMLSRSVETISTKFSAFEVVAITALSNITNSAVNAGKRILSSLTLEPVSTGFSEYELKMGSIQTIMASTGESLDRVNQKLDELNKYSDRTIYSFSDMTSNIGKFTNAGVKLDDAVAAIQGVSNVAAVSGANANEASRAMYNFAQALSAGYVKLIDWKSIENANMATVEFKTQLLESAVAAGTLKKTADGMYKTLKKGTVIDATHMFNDSLQEQWMTTEVLTKTLKDYADETTEIGKKAFAAAQDVKTWTQLLDTLKESAQSGWAETWQLVAGDYEEAKTTLRTFSEFFSSIIDGSAEARNSLLQGALMSSWGQIKDRVNETGISVDSFRESLRETAESSVDGLDKMIEEAGSFDATLSKGWLTTDILSNSLDNLVSKATGTKVRISELSDEQLKNVGYTQEQIDALRALSDEAKSSDSNLSSLVNTLDRQSGRELLFDSLLNGAKAVQGLFQTIKGAWRDIFPPATSEQIYSFIETLHSASERIRDFFTQAKDGADGLSTAVNKPLQDIRSTFKGLFAVIDIVRQAFSALWKALAPAGSTVGNLLTGILGVSGSFGEWLVRLDETIKKNDTFAKAIQTVIDWVRQATNSVKEFTESVRERFNLPTLDEAKESLKNFLDTAKEKIGAPGLELLKTTFEKLCELAGKVKNAIGDMKNGIVDAFSQVDTSVSGSKFVQTLSGIWDFVKRIASAITDLLSRSIQGLTNVIGNANFDGILDFLNTLAAGGLVIAIKNFIDSGNKLKGTISDFIDFSKKLGSGAIEILDSVRGCFEAYQNNLKANTLLKIAGAIAILSASIIALSFVDPEKLDRATGAITMLFIELIGSMAIFQKVAGQGTKGMTSASAAMVLMSASVLILAAAMKKLADLEWDDIAKGLIGVTGLSAIIVATSKSLSNTKAIKGATGLIVFAAALKILASVCTDLSALSWDQLAVGLVGVGALLAEVAVFLKLAKFEKGAVSTAIGIVILAAALKILASAAKDFGTMNAESLTQGLVSIGAILTALALFTKFTSGSTKMVSIGTGLVIVAASMKIFASAVGDFGSLSIETLAKGLVSMAVALTEVTVAMRSLPKNMVSLGTGLVIVAAALEILADVMGKLGGLSWEQIARGLVAMGGALLELAVALNFMKGTLAGSSALLVASTAMLALIPVMTVLGNLSWEQIAKGLLTLAGAFAVIGISATVLSGVMPAILGLGGALALIGVGVLAAAAGLTLMAAGITALGVALAAGATSIVAGLTVIITGIANLIPFIAQKIGEAIIEICKVIADGAPAIGEAVKQVILALVDVLVECVPAIAEGALALVTGVLEALVAYTPKIVDALFQFLIGVLEGIARNLPALIQAAVDVFMAFFSGIVDALMGIDTDVLLKAIVGIGLLAAIMAALSATAALAPGAMVGILAMGAVIAELALVLAAVGALAQIPGLNWLINEGGALLQSIGTAIGGFFGGIVGGFMGGVSAQFPKIGLDLSDFMTNAKPFIDGAAAIKPEMLDGVKALTEVILLLTAADILQGLTSWLTGGSSLSGFAEELVPFGEAMMNFSNSIQGLDSELVNNAAIAGKTLAEMASTLPNSGGVLGFFAGENDMETFGNQLVPFGEAMVAFANSVTGLDTDVVTNAATAGKAIAEMASTLPNSGGVVGFFAGENDMETFGAQLVPFGEAIMAYSNAVAGLDVEAVKNSATAGQAMVELANTLPNSGGAVAFFTGDNNLSDFGAQLVPFGTAIKAYSLAVAGLDVEAVTNSTIAGQALVELAKTVPNCGGLVSFFTGDNNISDFGNDIVSFGYSLRDYAEAIKDVKPDVVTASASAAGALSELATNLPDSSVFDKLFGGDQSLTDFGYDIAGFGEGMGYYYSQVSGIDADALSNVITQVWALVDLAEGMKDLDTSGFSSFSSSLNALGQAGINEFISAFDNSSVRVTASVTTMLGYVSAAISNGAPGIRVSMESLMTSLVSVVTVQTPRMSLAFTTMMTGMVTTVRVNGALINTSFQLIIAQSLSTLNGSVPKFTQAGKNVTQGFVDGIRANLQSAIQAANQLAQVTISAAQNTLQIKSPSKKFQMFGMYIDLGLAKGLNDNAGSATTAAIGVGTAIIQAFKERLKINSPSVVGKDEVGRYIVQGIGEGIKKDMSAEEAAAQKAKNIVTAFQKELDKADLDFSQFDMDYKLWEAQEGRSASDLEKDQRKRDLLNSKIEVQTSVIDLKKGEYDTLVSTVGENSTEAREAKIKWQQAILDLIDLQDELAAIDSEANERAINDIEKRLETAEKLLESRYESWKESNPDATEHDSAIKNLEYLSGRLALQAQRVEMAKTDMDNAIAQYGANSLEALEAESEYNDALKEANSIQNEINTAKSNEINRNREAAKKFYSVLNETWDWMHDMGYSDEDVRDYARDQSGFVDNIESIIDDAIKSAGDVSGLISEIPTKATELVNAQTTEALGTFTKDYTNLGGEYAKAMGTGLQNGAPEAVKTGVTAVSEAATTELASDTQKELWTNAATTLVDCFITGIQNNVERAAQAAAAMAVRAYSAAISAVQKSSGSGGTTMVVNGGARTGGTVTTMTPTTSTASAQAVAATSGKGKEKSDEKPSDKKPVEGATYNFTQNNYSPKALDSTTIYRQTNNQFSKFGKVVS